MGKKSRDKDKGSKKEKEPALSKTQSAGVKEALEASPPTISMPKATIPPRTTSKKMERIGCQESFKWISNETTPLELPPMHQRDDPLAFTKMLQQIANQGWKCYLEWRLFTSNESLIQEASRCTSLNDGLSAPLSVVSLYVSYTIERLYSIASAGNVKAYALEAASQVLYSGDPLHVVVVGATAVNEEKILKETKYWEELGRLLPGRRVHLYLTGMEMSGNYKRSGISVGGEEALEMTVECWKGNAADFLSEDDRLELFEREETVVAALNCGVGMAAVNLAKGTLNLPSNDVIWDWLPSFLLMAAMDLPVFFTDCIYEGAEKCLKVLQHVVGAYAILGMRIGTTPFETTVEARPGEVLKANSWAFGIRGLQAGLTTFDFSNDLDIEENDKRPEYLLDILSEALSATIYHPDLHGGVRNPRRLAPLRKYGDYTREIITEDQEDDEGELEGDAEEKEAFLGEKGTGEGREMCDAVVGPENIKRLHLNHTVEVMEDTSMVVVKLEGVFIADPSLARVGVQKKSLALYYEDCQDFREVLFESELPVEVNHKTTKVVFHPAGAQVVITIRFLEEK